MNRIIGILLIAVSAASFGTLAIFGRYAYRDGMDTVSVLFLRFLASAVLMAIWLLVRRIPLPRGRVLLQLIGMGALGYVGQSFAYLSAIQYASAGLVALLLYLYPVFVTVLSVLVLHEHVTRTKLAALALGVFGAALTVGPAGGQLAGILLAIAAGAIYSVYIIIGTGVMKKVSALQSSTVIFASAGTVYGILAAFHGLRLPASALGWWSMGGIVLFASLIPVVAFLAGLERVGPTNAAMLSTLEPVVTVLLAAWLFQERLKPVTLAGGALILTAVIVLARAELRRADPVEV